MHSKALAALFGLSLVACTGVIDGGGPGGGGDDTGGGESCGDGVMQAGEACDDGNTLGGDGCSASCTTEQTLMPRITATVDKPTLATENGKTETVTLTITSIDGYTGNVNVVPTFVDAANTPIPNVTVTGPSQVTVTSNATVPSQYQIQLPSNTTGSQLLANLKLDLSAPSGNETLMSAVTIEPIYVVTTAANTGNTINNHPLTNKNIVVKRGTIVRIMNTDTTVHITHAGGEWPHEGTDPATNGQPGQVYEINTIGAPPGSNGTIGCHTHGDATYGTLSAE